MNFSCKIPEEFLKPRTEFDNYFEGERLKQLNNAEQLIEGAYSDIYQENLPGKTISYYPRQIFSANAGFGLNTKLDPSETSLCVGADYSFNVSEDNPNGAFLVGPSAGYMYSSAGEWSSSMYYAGASGQYFRRGNRDGSLDFTGYAGAAYYGGTVDNFGSEEDVRGWGISTGLGANFNFDKWSIGLSIPVISFFDTTFESENFEFEQNGFKIGINKNNLVTARVIIPTNW